jgi:hypothetical protein
MKTAFLRAPARDRHCSRKLRERLERKHSQRDQLSAQCDEGHPQAASVPGKRALNLMMKKNVALKTAAKGNCTTAIFEFEQLSASRERCRRSD